MSQALNTLQHLQARLNHMRWAYHKSPLALAAPDQTLAFKGTHGLAQCGA